MKEIDADETVIVVEPPAPDFDDETTLISARPVVPIVAAKANERARIIRRRLPFIIGAVFVFGTLIGSGAGYYAKRRWFRVTVQQPRAVESKPEETSRVPPDEPQQIPSQSTAAQTSVLPGKSDNEGSAQANKASVTATSASLIPTKHTRHTTVHVSETLPMNQRRNLHRGAGRIQEIFSGPVPQ
jgi:hypothetical protein